MLFCTCCLASVALARVGTKERHEQRAGSHWSPVKSALQLVCICRVNLLSRQNHKTSVPASLKGAPPCRVLMFAPWLPVWSCWPREGQSEKQPGWPGPGASDEASTQPPPRPPRHHPRPACSFGWCWRMKSELWREIYCTIKEEWPTLGTIKTTLLWNDRGRRGN